MQQTGEERPFRFYDNREKYLMFTNTCSEKQETARRIGQEFEHLRPKPPALHVFQVGAGEGTLLSLVLRHLHHVWPSVPLLVVVKENSAEFIRMAVRNLADRFREHPQLVMVFSNIRYGSAPWHPAGDPLEPSSVKWRELALEGTSSDGFDAQINEALPYVNECWETTDSGTSGSPRPVHPAALVLYRADQAFALHRVIPRLERAVSGYDLIVASNPYRSRLSAEEKVQRLLAPLATSLAAGGRMVVIQAAGGDPGMEIIHQIWPDEEPFATPRKLLLDTLRQTLGNTEPEMLYPDASVARSRFSYQLQLNPDETESSIGTSTLLAGWNAAAYVAQIEDQRLTDAMSHAKYLEATRKVLLRHHGLWFNNECFVVAKPGD